MAAIKAGSEEAISYEQGTLAAKIWKVTVQSVSRYEADEIKDIRINAGMTQAIFPECKEYNSREIFDNSRELCKFFLYKMIEYDTVSPRGDV